MTPIPRTPKERAEALKALGAVVGKLPSYKRDEYSVECPRCKMFLGHDFKFHPEKATVYEHKVSLGDVKMSWDFIHKGEQTWSTARAHLIACHESKEAMPAGNPWNHPTVVLNQAVVSVHGLRRQLETMDEKARALVLAEIAAYISAPASSPGPQDG